MARPKARAGKSMGPLIAWNLYRLGYAEIAVKASELAKLVTEKTGASMTRQRISAIVNSARVEPETVAMIAEAVGVDPEELLRD